MEPRPISGTWFGDAKALLEMGATSIDAAMVRGLIREYEDLECALENAEYLLQYGIDGT